MTALFNMIHVRARKLCALRQVLVESIVEAIEISRRSTVYAGNTIR